jgi:hypothetical protein
MAWCGVARGGLFRTKVLCALTSGVSSQGPSEWAWIILFEECSCLTLLLSTRQV